MRANQAVELANETGVATSGTGESKTLTALGSGAIVFALRVSAVAAVVADKLDVTIQSTLDGTNWFDVCAFTQVAGNATPPKHEGWKINAQDAEASVLDLTATLAAGAKIDLTGNVFRAKWTITNDTGPVFDFTVNACTML